MILLRLQPLKLVNGCIRQIGLSVLILFATTSLLQAQYLIPELAFMNPKLETGANCSADGKDGAVYIFSNVGMGIDALISIQGRSSPLVTLTSRDRKGPDQDPVYGTGCDNAWQPGVSYRNGNAPAHSSWWMEFKISFVKHNDHSQSVFVNQFFVSGLNIGGDGKSLHEFQSYYNMHYFLLEKQVRMNTSSVTGCLANGHWTGNRFDGSIKNFAGVKAATPDVMVNNFYQNTNTLVVRVGAETGNGGSNAANRMYAFWFKSLAYNVPVNRPPGITLVAFNKVKLNYEAVRLGHIAMLWEKE